MISNLSASLFYCMLFAVMNFGIIILQSEVCLDEHGRLCRSLIISFIGSIFVNENEKFLKGSQPVLVVESKGHALHAFINKKLQGA